MIMSKTIAIGIALLGVTLLLGLTSELDLCEECVDIDKASAIIGGGFVGGLALLVCGYKETKRNKFLDGLDEAKDKILKDVKKALDGI